MIRDVALGAAAGFLIYLFAMGYNIVPLLFIVGGAYFIWRVVIERGMVRSPGKGVVVSSTPVTFDDIGGQATAKKELQEGLDFLRHSDRMKELGIRPLKGILLLGPPGTGKTLLAKAAARYTNSAFLAVSGSEFVQMYAGVGAERVRSLFKRAREVARKEKKHSAIIFIDEMDILGGKRGSNISHHEYDQTLNQLLVEMDGLGSDQNPQILVIGATNRAEALDAALLRPGRFDRQVNVDLPDKEGRLAILQIHTKNKPLAEDVDLEQIAHETFGFSGAHLESLTNEAAIFALREKSKVIVQKHLREAVEKVMLGEKLDRRPTADELWRVAVHEGGHALLAETVKPNSVAQISIRSRGHALGFVRHYPDDDLYLYTQEMLEQQIMVALAGAVAEHMILGTRSTGNAGDYEHALSMVERILASGMSTLGIIDLSRLNDGQRQKITREILAELEQKTRVVLEEKKETLLAVAKILQEEETVSGDALREFLHKVA
ncbi:AAA family ATPase [Paradesulfitobacterium ferrireducens]|uniref:AAA family ATPase n=1 Tax=Paradesulfitobacterium ferrireducens TaxID=2816476 RepID=UPI001A8FC568|nr:AAA family ATPase [Paradesulfitobacterium ferrireducens]